jgi:hypothetical protein
MRFSLFRTRVDMHVTRRPVASHSRDSFGIQHEMWPQYQKIQSHPTKNKNKNKKNRSNGGLLIERLRTFVPVSMHSGPDLNPGPAEYGTPGLPN